MIPTGQVHPMRQIVGQVQGAGIMHAPRIPALLLHEAVASYGSGPDYPTGEAVLAFLRYDFPERGRAQGSMASYLFTDRRLFGRIRASNIPDASVDVPYAHVNGARLETGFVNDKLHVQVGNAQVTLPMWGKTLHPLFAQLANVPPPHRSFPPEPPQPSQGDPTGAQGLYARALSGDARVGLALRVIHESAVRGAPAAVGVDLVQRAHVLDRGIATGRGMHQGWWLSTLPPATLGGLFQAMLGPAVNQWQEPTGPWFEFPASGGGGGSGLASSALGLALFATVGVGWISRSRGPGLRAIRASVTAKPCGAGFALLGSTGGTFGNLSLTSAGVVDAVSQALFKLEARVLLLQALLGPDPPPEALLATPRPEIESRVAALVGPSDLSPFFPEPRR